MNSSIRDHLSFLYGESAADEYAAVIDRLVRGARAEHSSRPRPSSPRDALLITYGDQVTDGGAAPLRTLGEFLAAHAGELINGVHILPFYPSSSDDGFSVMDYTTVDPALGSWSDIAALAGRFDLMFDAVFNHASAQGEWFARFLRRDPGWETAFVTIDGDPDLSQVVRPRALPLLTEFQTASGPARVWTTFSADQVDLNYADPRMLLRMLEVLLFYVKQGARYIRLDAIGFLWKIPGTSCIHLAQTHRLVQLMRAVTEAVAPDVRIITETNVPHPDNISYFGDGTNEAHLVYNFALPPLVAHTLRTGDPTKLRRWAADLTTPTDGVTYFNFLASHDGIGLNPARGILDPAEIDALVEGATAHGGLVSYKNNPDGSQSPYELNISYIDLLSDPAREPDETAAARFLAAHAIMLSLRGLPAIYFHSLFGSRSDRAAAVASGIPRRINRQKFTRAALDADLANPTSIRARVFSGMAALLRARAESPAFEPFAPQAVPDVAPGLFAVDRRANDQLVRCYVNVTDRVMEAPVDGRPFFASRATVTGTTITFRPYGICWLTRTWPP